MDVLLSFHGLKIAWSQLYGYGLSNSEDLVSSLWSDFLFEFLAFSSYQISKDKSYQIAEDKSINYGKHYSSKPFPWGSWDDSG